MDVLAWIVNVVDDRSKIVRGVDDRAEEDSTDTVAARR
jgi:hypothetical protein